ncbi:hypothetical protein HPP92_021296 [Vanilla planifolia]|uniref:Alcohol dehydrogenase-like N-terminal domain-containing protein n=1 Tax=Vanilla planifolia TaxID=51239 RepID=A0A835UJA6_VANPL|nr:hypothetical protein HPP92_021296 [Vanilla planifolia]
MVNVKKFSPEEEHPRKAFGLAAMDDSGVLYPFTFSRRHEIVGIVTETGSRVHKFKVGDRVGVGCLVNSCRSCYCCEQDLENHCPKMILTYNSIDTDGTPTYGGYSDMIVVNEHFVVKFPRAWPWMGSSTALCWHHGLQPFEELRSQQARKAHWRGGIGRARPSCCEVWQGFWSEGHRYKHIVEEEG